MSDIPAEPGGQHPPAPQQQGKGSLPGRPARELIGSAFALYRRNPLLFLALAIGVIAPYDVIVLALSGAGPLAGHSASAATRVIRSSVDLLLIVPLVSALHIHAVADVHAGRVPRLGDVMLRGVRALPVVVAATIMATLGIVIGLVLLVVPGIVLEFRWFVVAQAAAVEHGGWLPALRRSGQLTAGHYGHIFAFVVLLGLLTLLPFIIGQIAATGHASNVVPVLAGIAIHAFTVSIAALSTALLYYDLVARQSATPARPRSREFPPPDLL